jgi:hypothetical protein
MSGTFSLYVEIGSISSVYVPHNLRKVACGCFQQQVIVVAHQAVYVDYRTVTLCCSCQIIKKLLPVPLALEDVLLLIPS